MRIYRALALDEQERKIRQANLTRALFDSHRTATNLTQNSSA
ncbi:hypothetical protein [Campylobacter showae]|nr:hypothetical protein [Campylobacter showae]